LGKDRPGGTVNDTLHQKFVSGSKTMGCSTQVVTFRNVADATTFNPYSIFPATLLFDLLLFE